MSKTNNLSEIAVPKSGFKRSKFNWTHDVNTTFSWGEIQPTQCKLLVPNSKTTMQAQNLIRLAPMVAPTFGRVKYKTYNQFVGLSEIFPNLGSMLSQEPVTTAFGTQVAKGIPAVKLGQLSSWVLHGARCTLYYIDPSSPDVLQEYTEGHYLTSYKKWDSLLNAWSLPSDIGQILTELGSANIVGSYSDPYLSQSNQVLPDVGQRAVLYPHNIPALSEVFDDGDYIPLGIGNSAGLIPVQRGYVPDVSNGFRQLKDYEKEVTFESADYIIECTYDDDDNVTHYVAFAFELSDFGKRIRKIIQGCGYQVDFGSKTYVSILPILAQYKAYYDVFGLKLYQGWETTYCSRLIKYIENNFIDYMSYGHNSVSIVPNYNDVSAISNHNCFLAFMLTEVGNEWYTDEADYISAHMERMAVSPKPDPTGFISCGGAGGMYTNGNISTNGSDGVDGVNDLQKSTGSVDTTNTGLSYINRLQHSQVDATLLMRFYRWTNRNSILGRAIERILLAQNLGWYVEQVKSNFIGASDVLVTISDVVSQSDTFDPSTNTGATLGDYGGKGLQFTSDKPLSFENKEYGYWVTLATIVPQSGYTQGLDPTLTSLKKFDLYHADFDAIGMELSPKSIVVGCRYLVAKSKDYSPTDGFGFIPRMSKFKVCQNLVNGDFNRHGKRNVYLPYTLDKQLSVNDFSTNFSNYITGTFDRCAVKLVRTASCQAMPVAGNVWRIPTKYEWLGHFDRIFYNSGKRDDSASEGLEEIRDESACIGFSDYNDDNFLSHGIYEVKCYAPMKPIEESYGLGDEDNPTIDVEYTKKA